MAGQDDHCEENLKAEKSGDAVGHHELRLSSFGGITQKGAAGHASTAAERKLLWKMDLQLLPMAFLLYWLSFLDRTNVGVARLSGLEKSLNMQRNDYLIAVALVYPFYCLFEIPSNLIIRRITPGIYLPFLMLLWGLISTLQGVVVTKEGLYVNRLFLGLVEAGVLPGLVLWLVNFYKREEFMLRQCIYFAGATFAGAFSGLLATALTKMNGIAGRPGWAWIFIVEGVFTVFIALIIFFIMPSTPNQLWFCTPEEKVLAHRRLEVKRPEGASPDNFKLRDVLTTMINPRCLGMFVIGFAGACPIYGLAIFGPTIIKGNFPTKSPTEAQLLSSPPYAAAFVFSIFLALLSDKLQWRFLSAMISTVVAIIGFALCYALPLTKPSARYGALFIATAGTYTLPPSLLAWTPTFYPQHYKRATAVGMVLFGVSTGALAGTWFFPVQQAPAYRGGLLANMTMEIIIFFALIVVELLILRDRKQKAAGANDHLVAQLRKQGMSEELIQHELGDKHPDYKTAL